MRAIWSLLEWVVSGASWVLLLGSWLWPEAAEGGGLSEVRAVRLWTTSRGQKREAEAGSTADPGQRGASDLPGKLGSFVFTTLTGRVVLLILTAGAKPCHEVPRGGIGPQAQKEERTLGGGAVVAPLPLPLPDPEGSTAGQAAQPPRRLFPSWGRSVPIERGESNGSQSSL